MRRRSCRGLRRVSTRSSASGQLAEKAAARLADLGYGNVHVLHGDGTQGWPEHAPYDAIVVAAGGPEVPESLKEQLKIGGRLVIPVGADRALRNWCGSRAYPRHEYRSEDIADVRFVPLVGEEGWTTKGEGRRNRAGCRGRLHPPRKRWSATSPTLRALRRSIETADLDPLMERIGDRRASCCSARPPTAPPNSTGCASASRAT